MGNQGAAPVDAAFEKDKALLRVVGFGLSVIHNLARSDALLGPSGCFGDVFLEVVDSNVPHHLKSGREM